MKKLRFTLACLILLVPLTACMQNNISLQSSGNSSAENSVISNPFAEESDKSEASDSGSDISSDADVSTDSMLPQEIVSDLNKGGSNVAIANEESKQIIYNGGTVKLRIKITAIGKPNTRLNKSISLSVAINGIYQDISVNNGEKTKVHVCQFKAEDIRKNSNNEVSSFVDVEFTPVISKTDKDKAVLSLALVSGYNPDYRAGADYNSCAGLHRFADMVVREMHIKVPITDYCKENSIEPFDEKEITNELKKEFINIVDNDNFDKEGSIARFYLFSDKKSRILRLSEDGTAKIGMLFFPGDTENYRFVFFVNGEIAKLKDGSTYLEINNTAKDKIYIMESVEIDGVKPYDIVNAAILTVTDNDHTEKLRLGASSFAYIVSE